MFRQFASPLFPGILGAIVALGFFLPWISIPQLGFSGGPINLVGEIPLGDLISEAPLILLVPISCILGAIIALTAALGKGCNGGLAFFTGLIPLGLILYIVASPDAQDVMNSGFLRVSDLTEVLGIGLYMWVLGAVGLILVAIFAAKA